MTEQDLIDLRDSLVGFDSVLSALDARVTIVENAALPKGQYFTQLAASFRDSPVCCECTDTVTCNCVDATSDIYLQGDGDNVGITDMIVEINGIVYTPITGEEPSAYVPTEIVTFYAGVVYMYNSEDAYIQPVYYVRITNNTPDSLCVRLTTVQKDANDAPTILALSLPTVDENSLVLRARTAYGLGNGTDFTYTVNPTLEQDAGNSIVSNTATFCLSAV